MNKVEIGTNVTSIGNGAFSYMEIVDITIPNSVISIGEDAFLGATPMTNMTFQGKTLAQVSAMSNYPWGISDTSIINVA